jgi:hypothetical protein
VVLARAFIECRNAWQAFFLVFLSNHESTRMHTNETRGILHLNGNRAVSISRQVAACGVRVHPRAFDHTAGTFLQDAKNRFLQKATPKALREQAKETKIPWIE